MKKIIYILTIILFVSSGLTSCDNSEELPPKVDNSVRNYIEIKGAILTVDERSAIEAKNDEYNNATE